MKAALRDLQRQAAAELPSQGLHEDLSARAKVPGTVHYGYPVLYRVSVLYRYMYCSVQYRVPVPYCTGKKTLGGAGSHTGHKRDTRAHRYVYVPAPTVSFYRYCIFSANFENRKFATRAMRFVFVFETLFETVPSLFRRRRQCPRRRFAPTVQNTYWFKNTGGTGEPGSGYIWYRVWVHLLSGYVS